MAVPWNVSNPCVSFADLVLKLLSSAGSETDDAKETIGEIEQLMPLVKQTAAAYKKPGAAAE